MSKEAIITSPFRLAFPEVFVPKSTGRNGQPGTGEPKYSVTMLFPKSGKSLVPGLPGNPGLLDIRKILWTAAVEKWGKDKAAWPRKLVSVDPRAFVSPDGDDGWPIRDGDGVSWDGFAGHWFCRAASKSRPGCVDADVQPVITPGVVRGGLICKAAINAFAWENTGKKGVSLGLNALQIVLDDGVVFGGAGTSPFEPVAGGFSAGASSANGAFDDFGGVPTEPEDDGFGF